MAADIAADYLAPRGDDAVIGATDFSRPANRVLAAWGTSNPENRIGDRRPLRRFPLPVRNRSLDRGHLIALASGGGQNVSLVPQASPLNRGWSDQGRRWRSLERYCASTAGAFIFITVLYDDLSDISSSFLYGIEGPGRPLVDRPLRQPGLGPTTSARKARSTAADNGRPQMAAADRSVSTTPTGTPRCWHPCPRSWLARPPRRHHCLGRSRPPPHRQSWLDLQGTEPGHRADRPLLRPHRRRRPPRRRTPPRRPPPMARQRPLGHLRDRRRGRRRPLVSTPQAQCCRELPHARRSRRQPARLLRRRCWSRDDGACALRVLLLR